MNPEQEHKYLQERLDKLEKTVQEGFATLQAELKILAENYVRREEIDKRFDKKADKDDVLRNEASINKLDGRVWTISSAMASASAIISVIISKFL